VNSSKLVNSVNAADNNRHQRLKQLYSDAWISRLKGFVGRKYHNFGDWEGWFEEAHQNLALKIDRLPVDRELSDAMIFAIFKNELVSVKRHRLGYPRPRQWLREFSDLGQDLFEWMCLQRLSRKQIFQAATTKAQAASYSHTNADEPASLIALLEKLTTMMIQKKECDGVRPETDSIDGESISEIATDEPATEEYTDHEQLRLVLSLILGTESISEEVQLQARQRVSAMQESLQNSSLLNDLDILILRCYYFQGMSQNDIAKLIQQPLQKTVRRREAAVKKIREFMESYGLDRQSLLE